MATNINGKEISAPIWGGHRPALLAPWSEIKKLGFKKCDRSFTLGVVTRSKSADKSSEVGTLPPGDKSGIGFSSREAVLRSLRIETAPTG